MLTLHMCAHLIGLCGWVGCGNRGEFYVVDVGVNTGAITLKAAQVTTALALTRPFSLATHLTIP